MTSVMERVFTDGMMVGCMTETLVKTKGMEKVSSLGPTEPNMMGNSFMDNEKGLVFMSFVMVENTKDLGRTAVTMVLGTFDVVSKLTGISCEELTQLTFCLISSCSLEHVPGKTGAAIEVNGVMAWPMDEAWKLILMGECGMMANG